MVSLGQGITAFLPTKTAPLLGPFSGDTFGWGTAVLSTASPLRVTQIGIYDVAGDGLASAHEFALWSPGTRLGDWNQFYSGVVPAGTGQPFVDGYRFVDIIPFVLQPGQGFLFGTRYSQSDPDASLTPVDGVFSSQLFQYSAGGTGVGAELAPPDRPFCTGFELCQRLYPVNFRFETVPEPMSALFLTIASGVLVWLRGRRNVTAIRVSSCYCLVSGSECLRRFHNK